MIISGRQIGPGHPPYVIAELSGEHLGDRYRALDLIKAAKEAGADAAKLQCFDPLRLAEARGGKDKLLTEGLWKGRTLYDLYRETHTPREWFPELFAFAKEIGITLFSSVFDHEGVDFLETLGCPAYKISSFEVTDCDLIRKAASRGKPLILSTGMASDREIGNAIATAMPLVPNPLIVRHEEIADIKMTPGSLCYVDADAVIRSQVAVLHCVSSYPCSIADANLWRLSALRLQACVTMLTEESLVPVGLSDHTLGTTAAIVATALGAAIIEKHITLSRKEGGPDAAFSLEPAEFAKLVQDVKDAYASLGNGERPASEAPYRELRRRAS